MDGWPNDSGPRSSREVHIIAPHFSDYRFARGGTNAFRSLALAASMIGCTTCYELTPPGSKRVRRWHPEGIEIVAPNEATELFHELDRRHTPGSLIIKVSGGLRLFDYACDWHIVQLCRKKHSSAVYIDFDGPSRLPQMTGRNFYLEKLLPEFAAVLIFAGGTRAQHEYRSLGARNVHHRSAAISAAALLAELPELPCATTPDFDLIVSVGARSEREQRVLTTLRKVQQIQPALRVALVGDWPEPESIPPTWKMISARDPLDLLAIYARSRFALNVLRRDVSLYAHGPSSRVFETAVSGCSLATERFPGLASYLHPRQECVIVDSARDLLGAVRMDEMARRRMSQQARTRIEHQCREEMRAFASLLADV